jgi:hypothetical protein
MHNGDAMPCARVCYAIYPGVATKSARASQSGNIRLVTFDDFVERDGSQHFMPRVFAQTDACQII